MNPYDPEDYARLIRESISMPEVEQRERMARLRGTIGSIYTWMERFFRAWAEARYGSEATPAGTAAE